MLLLKYMWIIGSSLMFGAILTANSAHYHAVSHNLTAIIGAISLTGTLFFFWNDCVEEENVQKLRKELANRKAKRGR